MLEKTFRNLKMKLRLALIPGLVAGLFLPQALQAERLSLSGLKNQIDSNEARIMALEAADLGSQIAGLQSRIASLEAEPKANIATTAPTPLDDINAGFLVGSVWVDMTSKVAFILVDSAAGAAVWKLVTDPFYEIGDIGPAGGIVFYVTEDGFHGLEAAPGGDQGLGQWNCYFDLIPGADGTAIGTGAQNTANILAGCTNGIPVPARLADNYTLNGFDDWFLPSKDELKELYLQRDVVGGFLSTVYWSSSETSLSTAWAQNFENGGQIATNQKLSDARVRAIRAF